MLAALLCGAGLCTAALCGNAAGADPDSQQAEPWIDGVHEALYSRLWRSAKKLDHFFGSQEPDRVYQEIYGSIAPAVLWDEFHGLRPKLRFQINVPLPRLNERVHAVFGRVNTDEYIAENAPDSGAIERQYGRLRDDETILGLVYRDRHARTAAVSDSAPECACVRRSTPT